VTDLDLAFTPTVRPAEMITAHMALPDAPRWPPI